MRRLSLVMAAVGVLVTVVTLSAASWALSAAQLDCPLSEFEQRSSEVVERRDFPPRSVCRYTYYAPVDDATTTETDDATVAVIAFFASASGLASLAGTAVYKLLHRARRLDDSTMEARRASTR